MGSAASMALMAEARKPADARDVSSQDADSARAEVQRLRKQLRRTLRKAMPQMDSDALVGVAHSLGQIGAHNETERALRLAIERDPEHTTAFRRYHALLQGKVLRADASLPNARHLDRLRTKVRVYWNGQAAVRHPTSAALTMQSYLARASAAPDMEASMRYLKPASDQNFAPAHYHAGRCALMTQDTSQAIEAFERAVELDPFDVLSINQLGTIAWKDGDVDTAKGLFKRALEADRRQSYAHNNLGALLELEEGRLTEAAQHYRAAIAIDPSDQIAHFNLGRLLLAKLEALGEAAETDQIYRQRVESLKDDMLRVLHRAVSLNPLDARAHNSLAFVLHNITHDREAAEREYRAAITLEPGDMDYTFNLAHLLQEEVDGYDAAIKIYGSLIQLCGAMGNDAYLAHAALMLKETLVKAERYERRLRRERALKVKMAYKQHVMNQRVEAARAAKARAREVAARREAEKVAAKEMASLKPSAPQSDTFGEMPSPKLGTFARKKTRRRRESCAALLASAATAMAARDEVDRGEAKRKLDEEKAALKVLADHAATAKNAATFETLEVDRTTDLAEVKKPQRGRTRRRRLSMVPTAAQHRGRVGARGHVGGDGHNAIVIAKDVFFAHALDEGGTSAADRRAARGQTEEALIEDAVKEMERENSKPRITFRKSSIGTPSTPSPRRITSTGGRGGCHSPVSTSLSLLSPYADEVAAKKTAGELGHTLLEMPSVGDGDGT
jgi:tetratricopeptide (TPR) repeat protein